MGPSFLRGFRMVRSYPDWLDGFPMGFKNDVMDAVQATDHSRIVAVDADGTLWRKDLGEHFLQWLCGLVDGGPEPSILPASVWKDYLKLLKKDRAGAYGFAVQVMAGIEFADLVTWMDYVASTWRYYKPRMAALLNGLREEGGMKVYVVTASNAWLIRRGLLYLDADVDGVFGIETEMDSIPGIGLLLSDRLVQPIVCNRGKLEVLQTHAGSPAIAIGDSLIDVEMMEASRWRLVVGHAGEPESDLLKLAKKRGWNRHLF
jgi:phosphoserine phosphatase